MQRTIARAKIAERMDDVAPLINARVMPMTHQQTSQMTEEERTSRNIEDIFGFLKELVERPEMIEHIPDGSRLHVAPVDDENGHRDGEPVARTPHYHAYVVQRTKPENDKSH